MQPFGSFAPPFGAMGGFGGLMGGMHGMMDANGGQSMMFSSSTVSYGGPGGVTYTR